MYEVNKAAFSSARFDDFSPVFYEGGLVFVSNRGGSAFVDYSGGQEKGPVGMFFVEKDAKGNWKRAKLFSKDLSTKFNDGPITFNATGDLSYFSRNMFIIRNQKKNPFYRNKLGLFWAVKNGKEWTNIKPFRHNNDWFNITTPYMAPDGKRLYFSSDKPDGFGGADLYYCEWQNGYWGEPVNLGPKINTDKNEAYPFLNEVGELFFSSNGHPGLGGKDIFVTKRKGDGWHQPVRLNSPINSAHDDFGIVTDALLDSGYFSSQRERSIDIYGFKTMQHQVWFAQPQKENNYCVPFTNKSAIKVDTLLFQYQWSFADGNTRYGKSVKYCFPESGRYLVNINVVDRASKEIFFHVSTLEVEVRNVEQPFISAEDYVLLGDSIYMDGLKTEFPNHEILKFYWQIDDTTFKQGAHIAYQYKRAGEHTVKLAVALQSKETGKKSKRAVSKDIQVFASEKEKQQYIETVATALNEDVVSEEKGNFKIKTIYQADKNATKESVFRLQLLRSNEKVPFESSVFERVPSKYQIQERFNSADSTFIYFIDEQAQLQSLYPAYKHIVSSGFETARVTYNSLTHPAEKELFRINQKYGVQSDEFFNSRNTLITNGILMLNNIVNLLNKYPEIIMEVRVHTDNMASASQSLNLSKIRARKITDYLVSSGISNDRIIPVGKGEAFPIRSNLLEKGRRMNRRLEFKIFK